MSQQPRLARFDEDGWELESAEARVVESGEKFWIAPLNERMSLGPEDQAKLLFRIRTEPGLYDADEHVERMWVTVINREDNFYVGALDNQPKQPGRTYLGMPVRFLPEHVVEVGRADHSPEQ